MNAKQSSKLPQIVPNSEYGDFSRKQNTIWNLDENITKIINKYKRYAPYKETQAKYVINEIIENKKSIEQAQPLKIKTHRSSERQNNSVCENSCSIKSNKNKFSSVINKNTITRADKTTYCRPVTKYIPEVNRIAMKRNGLRNIFQNLSTLRQKEVEESLMSNYISLLKKKHSDIPKEGHSFFCIQDTIDSKARMKYLRKRNLMEDDQIEQYMPYSTISKTYQYRFHSRLNSIEDQAYGRVCYPVLRSPCKVFRVLQNGQKNMFFDENRYKNCSTQVNENIVHYDKSATTKYVEKKDNQKQEKITANSVLTIENKIDTLIQAMNDFRYEMYLLKITNLADREKKKGNSEPQILGEELMDYNLKKHRNIVSYTYLPSREQKSCRLEETVVNPHKANFDKINKKSSIQITCKVSTRDDCTEISRSLSRQIINCKIIADTSQTEKTTIALNTDPVTLRALLKISSEAIREFFSIDFLSYLPYLQLPRLEWSDPRPCLCDTRTNVNVDKITNRCFSRPCSSKLACVGPYKCQYCDKVFDKACSWERHEFYCARTLKGLERKCAMHRVC